MGQETGLITKVEKDRMTVQLNNGEGCSVCAAKSACVFAGPQSNYRYIKVPAIPGAREGQLVTLEYREMSKVVAALVVFILPILFILGGYALGDTVLKTSVTGTWGAVGGFVLSIGVLYLMNRWLAHSRLFRPKVKAQLAGPGSMDWHDSQGY
jgi:positive regulator of sigma E activity